ncbi:hypothetical protein [Acidisphaera sp. S103]|nr:hypothetical protein [Acidisphaera sp. S103]
MFARSFMAAGSFCLLLRLSGTFFLAFFDPFSAHGLVTAVDDCFG